MRTRTFRMVVSGTMSPPYFGQRVSASRVITNDDCIKAVTKAAAGRRWIRNWEKHGGHNSWDRVWVFRGSFVDGEYRGRASSPRTFYIEPEAA